VGEVQSLLRTIAVEADRTGQPLGLGSAEQLQAWPHARLHPLTYDKLELLDEQAERPLPLAEHEEGEEEGGRRVREAQLWIGLARAALAGQIGEDEAPPTKPAVIAKAIDDHPKAEGYDQVIVGYLLQIANELRAAGGEGALELRRRTSRLVRELKPETLRRLVQMGGDGAQRKRFVLDATDGMAVDAVVEVLKAAAEASQQNISHSLVRMLDKLAAHAESGAPQARAVADGALRDQVKRLLGGWELDDPNPSEYGAALQRLAVTRPLVVAPQEGTLAAEDERVLETSLEIGAVGPIVWRAVDHLLEEGRAGDILDRVDTSGNELDTSGAAQAIRLRVTTPEQLHRALAAEPPDLVLLDRMLAVLGYDAAGPLLDELASSRSRTVRRALLERLGKMGPAIATEVLARLDDQRWFVVRNLLALLEEWPERPPEFTAMPYAIHPDVRVRRQALKLQLRMPAEREQAIAGALADPDPQVVTWGLLAAQSGLPESALPLVETHARPGGPPELRSLALKALGQSRDPTVLPILLAATEGGRTLLGRPKLPPKSRELLAALRALADGWSHDPRVATVLARAGASDDADIRAAVG
jgi:HEAT repeat protein